MLTTGVARFATFSGFLANTFLPLKGVPPVEPIREPDLQATLREVERLHAAQQSELARLRPQLAEVEPTVV